MIYCFRAECDVDVDRFSAILVEIDPSAKITRFPYSISPDVSVALVTILRLPRIRELMRKVPDSHVMIQSLNTSELYTGERDYDIAW